MNAITMLLGATGVLLVVAIIFSFGAMKSGTKDEEVERLKREIAALKVSDQPMAPLNPQNYPSATTALAPPVAPIIPVQPSNPAQPGVPPIAGRTPPPATPPSLPTNPVVSHNDESSASAADLEKELAEAERAAELAGALDRPESSAAISAAAIDENRAEQIAKALVLARVTQWDPEHGFAVIEILNPEAVQTDTKLAIRRQTGIRGLLTVGQLHPGGQAVANPDPRTFLGGAGIDVQPGDELIAPPL